MGGLDGRIFAGASAGLADERARVAAAGNIYWSQQAAPAIGTAEGRADAAVGPPLPEVTGVCPLPNRAGPLKGSPIGASLVGRDWGREGGGPQRSWRCVL